MFLILLTLFVAVPLAEIYILRALLEATSWPLTIGVVLATAFIGATLARIQGLGAWRRIYTAMATAKAPGTELIDGVMILLAGAVLITPGLLTDALGFLLLVPPFRRWLGRRAVSFFKTRTLARFTAATAQRGAAPNEPSAPGEPTVIDAEFERIE